jgi:osmotically-inducible protein OsmY
VDGVRNVEANALVVQTWQRPRRELFVAQRSDREIADAIKTAVSYDPRVRSFDIKVLVADGACTLAGTVDTVNARLAAEALTRNVLGVSSLKNELVVLPRKALQDREIAARVKDTLLFDPMIEAHDIVVTVKDGQISLTGSVATFFESSEAFDAASRLTGAAQVDNELKVKDASVPYVYSAYLDPFTPYVEGWHTGNLKAAEADSNIARHVHTEFNRSPFIESQHINVAVLGGTVTLTGVVCTLRERRAAVQNALEAGAVAVDNQLKIG